MDYFLKLIDVSRVRFDFDKEEVSFALPSGYRKSQSLSGPKWDFMAHPLVPVMLMHIKHTAGKCQRLLDK